MFRHARTCAVIFLPLVWIAGFRLCFVGMIREGRGGVSSGLTGTSWGRFGFEGFSNVRQTVWVVVRVRCFVYHSCSFLVIGTHSTSQPRGSSHSPHRNILLSIQSQDTTRERPSCGANTTKVSHFFLARKSVIRGLIYRAQYLPGPISCFCLCGRIPKHFRPVTTAGCTTACTGHGAK